MTPPASAAASARTLPRPATRPQPRTAPPRRPRRISGPARQPGSTPRSRQPATQPAGGLALGVLKGLRVVSRHRALDGLIRGRVWIVLIAFALIGIVALQLLVLSLNASIGRALVRQAALQRANAALSIENSEQASGERVEMRAARLGMQLVPIASLRFLTSDPRANLARAAAALDTPVHTASSTSTPADATSQATEAPVAQTPASTLSEPAAAPTSPAATVTAPPAATPLAPAESGASAQATSASSAGGVGVASAGEPNQQQGSG